MPTADREAGYEPIASGVYPVKLDYAYYEESAGGALALKINVVSTDHRDVNFRQSLWLTSGRAKGKKNYYTDSEGRKRLLPDMNRANNMANILCGKDLADLQVEAKVIRLWNYEKQDTVNTKVNMVTDLIGKEFLAAVLRTVENKRVRDDNDNWVPGPEKRTFNEIDTMFNTDGFTAKEIQSQAKERKAMDIWERRNSGHDNNQYDARVAQVETVTVSTDTTTTNGPVDDLPF
jgi:hypothetical protein